MTIEIETPHGLARAHLRLAPKPRGAVVLGHGAGGGIAAPSRIDELDAVTVPTLVIQGERDPFGLPPPAATREVVVVKGDHALKVDVPRIADAATAWLDALL